MQTSPADDKATFLAEFRALRDRACIDYDELAARTHFPTDLLKSAETGPGLPGLPVVAAYVRACGGDVTEWEERWRRLGGTGGNDTGLPTRPAGASPAARAGARAGVSVAPAEVHDPERIRKALRAHQEREEKGTTQTGRPDGNGPAPGGNGSSAGWHVGSQGGQAAPERGPASPELGMQNGGMSVGTMLASESAESAGSAGDAGAASELTSRFGQHGTNGAGELHAPGTRLGQATAAEPRPAAGSADAAVPVPRPGHPGPSAHAHAHAPERPAAGRVGGGLGQSRVTNTGQARQLRLMILLVVLVIIVCVTALVLT